MDCESFKGSSKRLQVEFDHIFTAQDIGSYKPNQRNFDYMIAKLAAEGIGKQEILHTAESLFHDHLPANKAGLASTWIYRRHGQQGFGATQSPGTMPRYAGPAHIILNDNKSSTYKLALLRTLCRIADGCLGMVRQTDDDAVEIPHGLVALFWIRQFKPLLDLKFPQSPSNDSPPPQSVTMNWTSSGILTITSPPKSVFRTQSPGSCSHPFSTLASPIA